MKVINILEKAYKRGNKNINITIDEYNELLYGDDIKDIMFMCDSNENGNYATYKDTLKIWVSLGTGQ